MSLKLALMNWQHSSSEIGSFDESQVWIANGDTVIARSLPSIQRLTDAFLPAERMQSISTLALTYRQRAIKRLLSCEDVLNATVRLA